MSHDASELSCPVEAMFRVLMRPWTMYILWTLRREGSLRFGVLKERLDGVSPKVLTERLRLLEANGLVSRQHKPTIPPEVTYGLTKFGQELGNALDSLESVARRWERRAKAAQKPEARLARTATLRVRA